MRRSDAIAAFLKSHTRADLAALYSPAMECQVNASPDGGERQESGSYTDGEEVWYSFRMPKNARAHSEDNDVQLHWDLSQHAEAIGLTGWDWQAKRSRWVAFDFDSIVGHKSGLSPADLIAVQEAAAALPWVTVRRSTGGKGLHLYVFLDVDVEVANHVEHAAIGRAVLGKMSALTGFDFSSRVDICGSNMWVWHRNMSPEAGYALVKRGESLDNIPPNWREHVHTIKGKPKNSDIDKLAGQYEHVTLTEEHKRVLLFLNEHNARWWWDQDRHLLVCHTYDLKLAHEKLKLRGVFDTVATGAEQGGDHNCFCVPLPDGAWVVRRYTIGVQEASPWQIEDNQYTKCFFNRDPDLRTVALLHKGVEIESGGYAFQYAGVAAEALKALGLDAHLPDWAKFRAATLDYTKDGRLIATIEAASEDKELDPPEGWSLRPRKGWQRLFSGAQQDAFTDKNYDNVIRYLGNKNWCYRTLDDGWEDTDFRHAKTFLLNVVDTGPKADKVMAEAIHRPWQLVVEPFQTEYLGDRRWNRHAPQLRYTPSQQTDLNFPTWDLLLGHLGKNLTPAVKMHPWCCEHGVAAGRDYLFLWIASLFQHPYKRLPYLFLFSPEQETGKTSFTSAVQRLMTTGVKHCPNVFSSNSNFNGEIEGQLLCTVEEGDINNKVALGRLNDWTTNETISIHKKFCTPYDVRNTTHWVQTANDFRYCPVFAGDKRITVIRVDPLDNAMNMGEFYTYLEREAPDFLAAILRANIPHTSGRLNLPMLDTDEKAVAAASNRGEVERFLDEVCQYAPGAALQFKDLYEHFNDWLLPEKKLLWSRKAFSRQLPSRYPTGIYNGSRCYVGNIALQDVEVVAGLVLVKEGRNLVHQKGEDK